MIITSILNNNAIVAKDKGNPEVVVFGTGIGFKKRQGDTVDESKIQAIYVNNVEGLALTKHQIPAKVLQTVNEIFTLAKKRGLTNLTDAIFFSLSDHLHASVQRKLRRIQLSNPFLYELETYFPEEWGLAMDCGDIIKNNLNVVMDKDELGFIALHLLAEDKLVENVGVKGSMRIIDDIMAIAISGLGLSDETIMNSFQYTRLLRHVKLFAYRFMSDDQLKDTHDLSMTDLLGNQFDVELECIGVISGYLKERYDKVITNQETLYLAIHFKNCRLMKS